MKRLIWILLLMALAKYSLTSQSISCLNTEIGTINANQMLDALNPSIVNLNANITNAIQPSNMPTCYNYLQKVRLVLKFDLGVDYEFGSTPWNVNTSGLVEVKSGGTVYHTFNFAVNINENQPEQVTVLEYPNLCFFLFSSDFKFTFAPGVFNLSPAMSNAFRCEVSYEFEDKQDVYAVNIALNDIGPNTVIQNPVQFSWNPSCTCTPNYELQVLRLYNIDPTKLSEKDITAKVDWKEAMSIETQSFDPNLVLTLTEGTGFYLWRVRPIGNYFDGGYGNSQNWGTWSDAAVWQNLEANGGTLSITDTETLPYAFYYQQFDDTLNWIYSRTFSEAERVMGGKVKIAEEMTYANGLQQGRQQQKHLFSQSNIVANSSILDYTGRPALTTIYAPVTNQDRLGFVPDMAMQSSINYDAQHYDSDANYKMPLPVDDGKIINYYDNGADKTIPSSEGYPYTRTIYYGDGMGRVKESSGIGSPLKINNTNNAPPSHTTKYYYSGVSDTEIVRIFGDEAPSANSVIKMLTIDPNQTTSVTYQTKEGQTIATCLSTSANQDHHLPLDTRSSFEVHDTISGDILCGDYCLQSSKTVAFGAPTQVTLNYILDPNMVESICNLACASCEYKVYFYIKRLDDVYDSAYPVVDSLVIPQDICNLTDFYWDTILVLGPGTFSIERKIVTNNTSPTTITTNTPLGNTYLEEQIDALEATLLSNGYNNPTWQVIQSYIDGADLSGLYQYLETTHNLAPEDTTFTFQTNCCAITIPIIRCDTCKIVDDDFEAYYNSIIPSDSIAGDNPGTLALEYLPDYNNGQFNLLIQNMLNEGGYPYDTLCECWTKIVQSWNSIVKAIVQAGGTPDLLHSFLTCTGYKFENSPFSNVDFTTGSTIPKGYLSHAYAYFNYDPSSPSPCEQMYIQETLTSATPVPQNTSTQINWVDPFFNNWENDDWLEFYNCVEGFDPNAVITDLNDTINDFITTMADSCMSACDKRYESYIAALTYYYEQELGQLVGDCEGCIDTLEIQCMAANLVAHCKTYCDPLSIITDSDGNFVSIDLIDTINYYTAMYYAFEVVGAGADGQCPQGFENISNENNYLFLSALDFINEWYDDLPSENPEMTQFNFYELLTLEADDDDEWLFNQISCDPDIMVPVLSYGNFYIEGCSLIFSAEAINLVVCEDICLNFDQDLPNCPVCIRYFPIKIDSVFEFEAITCEEQTADYLNNIMQNQLLACVEVQKQNYYDHYINSCLNINAIKDTFSLKYELGYYHYTLYYYDRAGNLVQTIPPKGLDDVPTINRMENPAHAMKTQYRYNTLKQLIWQFTPDGDSTRFIYDNKGQLRFSQNEQQKVDGAYAYTRYDYLGRIIEVGRSLLTIPWANMKAETITEDYNYPSTYLSERVFTNYNTPYDQGITGGRMQRFLLNRVSYTYTDDDGDLSDKEDQRTTIYSYDPHGNVEWVVNDIMPELTLSSPTVRQIISEYDYDLISNKVIQLSYMKGRADQFLTKYSYDEDNRITEVKTSIDGRVWDRDGRYYYYDHGPLKRHVIGEDKIQGIDHVYSIQGWLKSINHPTLDMPRDPGLDGVPGSKVPKDVFASGLTYFTNDFVKSGSQFIVGNFDRSNTAPIKNLFNGNISQWVSNSDVPSVALPNFKYPGLTSRSFVYDELNRIKSSDFSNYATSWKTTREYDSNYSYDPNGNITKLNRNAYNAIPGTIPQMDALLYTYTSGPLRTNRLDTVIDNSSVPSTTYLGDLEGTSTYKYDKTGNTIEDPNNGITNISWNLMGKVKKITKSDGTIIDFAYDAMGHRILKKVSPTTGNPDYTWYALDASGNQLSTYKKLLISGGPSFRITQDDQLIYGSDRLANRTTKKMAILFDGASYSNQMAPSSMNFNRIMGQKLYELKDHLGNVRMNVTDIKEITGGTFAANIKGVYEYYPFGSQMVGRVFDGEYRYGFNGQEKTKEIDEFGNHNTALFWEYDSRIARRWNVDPITLPWCSNFSVFYNNPNYFIDQYGLSPNKPPLGARVRQWFKVQYSKLTGGTLPVTTTPNKKDKKGKYRRNQSVGQIESGSIINPNTDDDDINLMQPIAPKIDKLENELIIFQINPVILAPRPKPSLDIHFKAGETKFQSENSAINEILPLVNYLNENKTSKVLLRGNSGSGSESNIGNSDEVLNQGTWVDGKWGSIRELHIGRARAVERILIKYGIDPSRVKVGVGSNGNSSTNRRVDVIYK